MNYSLSSIRVNAMPWDVIKCSTPEKYKILVGCVGETIRLVKTLPTNFNGNYEEVGLQTIFPLYG